jgi:two-component system, NtrC family, sensor kinase
VQQPVGKLKDGTRAVSSGQLSHRIEIRSGDDLGDLAASFNRMTEELERAEAVNHSWALTLEDKVRQKTAELQRAQAHLLQMDKMASLGKLAATVAHEINNPLSGILTYARLLERDLGSFESDPERRAHAERSLGIIAAETRRCGGIVQNLLSFARTSGPQMVSAKLDPLVEAALSLVQHHLDLSSIETVRQLAAGEAEVVCAPGEIQQAVLALLVNAGEAMPAGGKLTVATAVDADTARIAVADEGIGIPTDVLPHIFEPFFTTKSAAKGVGLGLAVVYGIMQRHGGHVEIQSAIDRGSTLTLVWPRRAAVRRPGTDSPASAGASVGGEAT